MEKKYNNCTSIRFDEDIKPWLYRKMQTENRSLGNLVNTILKQEKERNELWQSLNEAQIKITGTPLQDNFDMKPYWKELIRLENEAKDNETKERPY